MNIPLSRRDFLATSTAAAVSGLDLTLASTGTRAAIEQPAPINVVVWDEQQPKQKEVYPDFLGNSVAKYLRSRPSLNVKSVKLADPDQGLADDTIRDCQVLIWWGHVKHDAIKPETGKKLVERIKEGKLALIALHSAHWSTPFVEAMNERTRMNTEKKYPIGGKEKYEITYQPPPRRYTTPKADERVTPYETLRKFPDGTTRVTVRLPLCVFPAYREDGKPSQIKFLVPDHPIAKGLPNPFELAHTEMYDEPFHVPDPDEVVLEERWPGGEWFRSGMVWWVGKGKVFYLRPGHETYPIYQDKMMLQLVENAVRWLAEKG